MDSLPQPTEHFRWAQAAGLQRLPALVCEPLLDVAEHLFTTRHWPLGNRSPDGGRGWDEVAGALGLEPARLRRVRQVHGASVAVASAGDEARPRPDADIVVCGRTDLGVAVQVADCVPILAADRRTGTVAAAHAGWRGLAANVPGAMMSALRREFGSRPEDLTIGVGPSIGPCCYEVGEDVRAAFAAAFSDDEVARWFAAAVPPGKWMFDTWASTRGQLEKAGVRSDRIFESRLCTATHRDVFCSYRRDGPPAGRMAAAIRPRGRR